MADIAIEPAFSFIDTNHFDKVSSKKTHLAFELGSDFLGICLFDTNTSKCLALEHFDFFESPTSYATKQEIEDALNASLLVKKAEQSTTVSLAFNHHFSTIIPTPLFNEKKVNEYFLTNFEPQDDSKIISEELPNLKAINVFASPTMASGVFKKRFPSISFHHFSSFLIESYVLKFKNSHSPKAVINLNAKNFQLMVFSDKGFTLYNSFKYQNEDEFVYFIMFTFEQLKMNAEEIEVRILGELDFMSNELKKLKVYVKNITLEKFTPNTFENQPEPIVSSKHFALLNQYLCAL